MCLKKKIAIFSILLLFFIAGYLLTGIWGVYQIHVVQNKILTTLKIQDKFQELIMCFERSLKGPHNYLIFGKQHERMILSRACQSIYEEKDSLNSLIEREILESDPKFEKLLLETKERFLTLDERFAEYEMLGSKLMNIENPVGNPEAGLLMKDMDLSIWGIEESLQNEKIIWSEFSDTVLEESNIICRKVVILLLVLGTFIILAGILLGYYIVKFILSHSRSEEKLLEGQEESDPVTLKKCEFFANMSHEIRTPMNGILSMTELVLDTKLDREQKEYLEMIKTSAEYLCAIIKSMMDFSKLETGHLDLEEEDLNLRAVLEQTLEILDFRAHEKGLQLILKVDTGVPSNLIGDPVRLYQIFVNLVGNALKFTETGVVVISCEVQDKLRDSILLHFTVSDTGIGIPKDKFNIIFEGFYQIEKFYACGRKGAGLGLSISKELVKMMGGDIWVESRLGKGSTFHFTARFRLQPEEKLSRSTVVVR